jgi:hypothetical protein
MVLRLKLDNAAAELEQAVRVLGDAVPGREIVGRLSKKYFQELIAKPK